MSEIRTFAIYIALVVVGSAGIFGAGYFAGWESMVVRYSNLAGKVQASNDLAAKRLAELTEDRDKKEALLRVMALEQKRIDEEAKDEINRLAIELSNRPIRVRVTEGGSCSSGDASGSATGNAADSPGNTDAPYGLLPEENTRRLRAALNEIETLSAAYNSCKASFRTL